MYIITRILILSTCTCGCCLPTAVSRSCVYESTDQPPDPGYMSDMKPCVWLNVTCLNALHRDLCTSERWPYSNQKVSSLKETHSYPTTQISCWRYTCTCCYGLIYSLHHDYCYIWFCITRSSVSPHVNEKFALKWTKRAVAKLAK